MKQGRDINNKSELELVNGLREVSADLLNHHLTVAKNWYPHEHVPFSEARDYLPNERWSADDYPLEDGVRSALYVNLLTEDNLPYYTNTIISSVEDGHPLQEWTRRWTAEENRHSMVIRDWILATRALDPKVLEEGRMAQMSSGIVPQPDTLTDLIVYTSLQELATQVAHRNTGKKIGKDKMGLKVMALVAGDEGLHHEYYSGLVSAAIEIDPSTVVIAACRQLVNFQMPGVGIPDFRKHSRAIEKAGIYDTNQFIDMVVKPTFDKWKITELNNLSDEAELARDKILKHMDRLGKLALRRQVMLQNTEE